MGMSVSDMVTGGREDHLREHRLESRSLGLMEVGVGRAGFERGLPIRLSFGQRSSGTCRKLSLSWTSLDDRHRLSRSAYLAG